MGIEQALTLVYWIGLAAQGLLLGRLLWTGLWRWYPEVLVFVLIDGGQMLVYLAWQGMSLQWSLVLRLVSAFLVILVSRGLYLRGLGPYAGLQSVARKGFRVMVPVLLLLASASLSLEFVFQDLDSVVSRELAWERVLYSVGLLLLVALVGIQRFFRLEFTNNQRVALYAWFGLMLLQQVAILSWLFGRGYLEAREQIAIALLGAMLYVWWAWMMRGDGEKVARMGESGKDAEEMMKKLRKAGGQLQ